MLRWPRAPRGLERLCVGCGHLDDEAQPDGASCSHCGLSRRYSVGWQQHGGTALSVLGKIMLSLLAGSALAACLATLLDPSHWLNKLHYLFLVLPLGAMTVAALLLFVEELRDLWRGKDLHYSLELDPLFGLRNGRRLMVEAWVDRKGRLRRATGVSSWSTTPRDEPHEGELPPAQMAVLSTLAHLELRSLLRVYDGQQWQWQRQLQREARATDSYRADAVDPHWQCTASNRMRVHLHLPSCLSDETRAQLGQRLGPTTSGAYELPDLLERLADDAEALAALESLGNTVHVHVTRPLRPSDKSGSPRERRTRELASLLTSPGSDDDE